ncbi:hypothetical protein RJT34_10786 [Clitoria ternatea]|uniref:Uncharacterized protein n=1 Tax=Clitoria ternatea TaxID=43366 RepID=A0AAN9JIP6_CLITE
MLTTTKGTNLMFARIPKMFSTIDLSRNKFEGEIPNVIGELHALKGLNLSHNKLIGPIPHSMGNLKNLEWLDLSSNMLIGRIPLELTSLNFLEVLNLSHNHLVGEIPQGKQFNTFPNDSYEGNLGLCGSPLLIQCNISPKQNSQPSNTIWGEHKLGFGWEPVAIGYGCGMVFGIGLGCCVLLTGKPQWLVRIIGGGLHMKASGVKGKWHALRLRLMHAPPLSLCLSNPKFSTVPPNTILPFPVYTLSLHCSSLSYSAPHIQFFSPL